MDCRRSGLADDLHQWLAQGTVTPEVLQQVSEELREIAQALDTGAPISPIPTIPPAPRRARHSFRRRGYQERSFADDETPF